MNSKISINREIVRLAIPNILSNISVPLLSTVDTALMGNLSAAHIGAIGISSMIFNFLYWNFGFLRMGTTGLTAQAYGRQDHEEIMAVIGRSAILVITISLFLLLFRDQIAQLGIYLMNVTDEQKPLMLEYFFIRIWAAPAALGIYVLMGWYFGMQNAFIPLVLTLVSNVVNIGLSYYLTINLDLGIRGVAWGTVVAQYIGFLGGLFWLLKYSAYFKSFKWKVIGHFQSFWSFILLNKDIFIRTVALSLVFSFFYSHSSTKGTTYLAVTVILMQFINWMSYGLDGLAFAAESLIGKYYGLKNYDRAKLAIRQIFIWSAIFAIGYSVLYAFSYPFIVSLFTDEVAIQQSIADYRIWLIIIPIVGVASYVWDGIFIGLTAAKSMRNSMLIALIVFGLSSYLTDKIWPLHSLWIALTLFLITRGVVQTWMYLKQGLEMR